MNNKLFKKQSFMLLVPFFGFVIILFWAMIVCYRKKKSYFSVLKFYLCLLIPLVVLSLIYFVLIYFFAAPLLETEKMAIGIFLIIFLAYILCLLCGVAGIIVEKLIMGKDFARATEEVNL